MIEINLHNSSSSTRTHSLNTSSQLLSLTPLGIIKLDTSQSSPNQSDQLRLNSRIRRPFSKLSKFLRLGRLLRLLMVFLELISLVLSNSTKIRKKVFVRAWTLSWWIMRRKLMHIRNFSLTTSSKWGKWESTLRFLNQNTSHKKRKKMSLKINRNYHCKKKLAGNRHLGSRCKARGKERLSHQLIKLVWIN